MPVPAYLPFFVVISAIAIIAAILFGLMKALSQPNGWTARRGLAGQILAAVLIGWFLAAASLAWMDVFHAAPDRFPTIQYGLLIPLLIGGWMILTSPRLRPIIDAVPQHWLIGVQLYRVLGGIFLVLYATGQLPGLFAWPAGLGDVLVGVLAPVVAITYARSPDKSADLVIAWNVFGIADLMVAVTAGFLTSPSAFQLFAFDLSSELMSQFPLVLIPTFLVPLSMLLHFASLMKLSRRAEPNHRRQEISHSPA